MDEELSKMNLQERRQYLIDTDKSIYTSKKKITKIINEMPESEIDYIIKQLIIYFRRERGIDDESN